MADQIVILIIHFSFFKLYDTGYDPRSWPHICLSAVYLKNIYSIFSARRIASVFFVAIYIFIVSDAINTWWLC